MLGLGQVSGPVKIRCTYVYYQREYNSNTYRTLDLILNLPKTKFLLHRTIN